MASSAQLETDGGLVTSQDPRSAEAGARVLAAGGNAVDAAIAAALAIGVIEPLWSGIGGSAWLTVWPGSGSVAVVEGAGRTPRAAGPEMYQLDQSNDSASLYGWPRVVDDANIRGARATYVPGAVAAFCLAHETFGRLPRAQLFEPAIELADQGVEVNGYLSSLIIQDAHHLRQDPGCRDVFLPDGLPLRPAGLGAASVMRQPALAETLDRIATEGSAGFYRGPVASSIAAAVEAGGGTLDSEDLRGYEATIVEPLEIDYAGFRIAVPPASGGPTALQALRLVDAQARRWPDAEPAVHWSRALRLAFNDRFAYFTADPKAEVPWGRAISDSYADELVASTPPPTVPDAPARSGCTSHLNVVDSDGMAVALTATLLDAFGARLLDPASGVLLNNGMMWFDPRPGRANSVRSAIPGLGAASPAILSRDGVLRGAAGATGGRRIISAVAEITDAITVGLDAQAAVDRPRLHCEGEVVSCDERMDASAIEALRASGKMVEVLEETGLTWHFGRANAITLAEDGLRTAGLDRLRPAGAAAA